MKTKLLLLIGAVTVAAATYSLYAGNGATFLTKYGSASAVKPAPLTEVVTVKYATQASTALLTPRAAGNASRVVVAAETAKAAKCPLIGTPKSIQIAGNQARMACCNVTLADCSANSICSK